MVSHQWSVSPAAATAAAAPPAGCITSWALTQSFRWDLLSLRCIYSSRGISFQNFTSFSICWISWINHNNTAVFNRASVAICTVGITTAKGARGLINTELPNFRMKHSVLKRLLILICVLVSSCSVHYVAKGRRTLQRSFILGLIFHIQSKPKLQRREISMLRHI